LSGNEVIIWEIITQGFEKVASYFEKIATTCTDPVRIETPLVSAHTKKAPNGCFFVSLK
jgi:hypothetical protein